MARKLQPTEAPAPAAVGGRPVTLQRPDTSPATVRYEPSPPFLLVYAPGRYQLDEHGAVVAQLGKMSIEPGVNGVDARGGWALAEAAQRSKGRTVIPEAAATADDTPDGLPGYLRVTETGSGAYYHTAWERLEVHAGQGVVVEVDPAGYRAWLSALVDRGVVAPVHERVLRRLRDHAQATADSAAARQGVGAERAYELARRQLDALDALGGAA